MTIADLDPSAVTALAREARRARRSVRLAGFGEPRLNSVYKKGRLLTGRHARQARIRSLPPDRDEPEEERPHR